MIDRRLVFAALALLAACSSHAPSRSTPAPAPAAPASANAPHSDSAHSVLLISIDGLRADMLDRGITPHLSQLAHDGVRARWMTPSYPSLTFPNHYTLVTGLRPDRHGIVHNSMRDATLGSFWLSKQDAVGDARWWGGEPLWVGAETHGLHAATWSWPGSEAAIGGVRPTRWRHYEEGTSLDARVDEVLGWLAASGADRNRLVTLYFEHVDEAGHDHGPESRQYADSVRAVDGAIGRLLAGMQRDGTRERTNIVVVSDHGMAEVPPGQAISVQDMVRPDIATAVTEGRSSALRHCRDSRHAPKPACSARMRSTTAGARRRCPHAGTTAPIRAFRRSCARCTKAGMHCSRTSWPGARAIRCAVRTASIRRCRRCAQCSWRRARIWRRARACRGSTTSMCMR